MKPYSKIACLVILSAVAFGQELTTDRRADLDRRINLQRNWNKNSNPPGANVEVASVDRTQVGRDVFVFVYELRAKGLPKDVSYELFALPTTASRAEETQSIGDVTVENDGRVVGTSLFVPDPAPGESYRFGLISKDGHGYRAAITLLPNPIEGKDRGCKVSVVRLTRNFEFAFLQGAGFAPDSEVAFRSNLEGQVQEQKMKADSSGYFDTGIVISRPGKRRGKMDMQFTSSSCTPRVVFKWGETEDGQPYQ